MDSDGIVSFEVPLRTQGEHVELCGETITAVLTEIEQAIINDIAKGAHAQMLRRMAIDNGGRPRLQRVK